MIGEAQVVVIGSGAFGSSTAYHLAARGCRNVVLLDAHDLASQTSPRAAGLTKQVRSHPDASRLAIRSVDKILRFTEDTGEPLAFVQSGSISIARGESDEAVVRSEVAAGKALGVETYQITYDEMTLAAPLVHSRDVRFIGYTPSDLYLEEPGELALGYARAAERLGVTVVANTPVTAIGVEDGRVTNVVAGQAEIRTATVVDAAGAWSRLVAAQIGIRVPLVPVRHQLYITEPLPELAPDHAICRIYDARVYIRPHRGSLLLGGYESDPQPFDVGGAAPEFQIRDLPLDLKVLERLAQSVQAQLPIGKDARIREHRGGLPTMTPDGLPIIGPVPSIHGLYLASGCCVGGLSIAPAVGEALAEMIHTDQPSPSLAAFSIARFGREYDAEPALRSACLRQYTERYAAIPPVPDPQ